MPLLPQDQRGTGRSTPITPGNLSRRGTPAEQAAYLKHFRCAGQEPLPPPLQSPCWRSAAGRRRWLSLA